MKMKNSVISFLTATLILFTANAASAQVQMNIITAPSSIPDPLGGFTVQYTMTGSKFGIGAATAELVFYLSSEADGSNNFGVLHSQQILLNGSGLGPYFPPSGTQSQFISRFGMDGTARQNLELIAEFCQPESLFIIGRIDFTTPRSDQTVFGTTKLPDFFFTGGTISPSVIQPGGSTNLSFDVFTDCPANRSSRVGIFLADANLQLIAFIGAVTISAGSGTSSLPPTPITFSSAIVPDFYHIVLLADVDSVIAESDENNNAGAFELDIVPAALADASGEDGKLDAEMRLPKEAAETLYELESEDGAGYIKQFDPGKR